MLEIKTMDKPDERRDFPGGHLEALNLTGLHLAVATFEPGWRWKESVRPIVGTDSCQVQHSGIIVQGRMRVRMDDGAEGEVGPGDVYVVPAGHEAWVVGDEQVVMYDVGGQMAETYAKSSDAGA
ncbi:MULTISPECIES: cupin domain-containing protein [Streptomyces]|uniref:Cupin n=1 Tax=Streptomyces violaceusniger TaxID=68280 RepID=A0A4D4LBA1_STRVO|nr:MULTISPECIES: cupin domain-containing protein [unclassified Streptomyces]MBD3010361.1 cupin domain-containing protein [Streptomyces sp. 5-10]GDY55279.1 cupin [Streptomyces violaceusniger]